MKGRASSDALNKNNQNCLMVVFIFSNKSQGVCCNLQAEVGAAVRVFCSRPYSALCPTGPLSSPVAAPVMQHSKQNIDTPPPPAIEVANEPEQPKEAVSTRRWPTFRARAARDHDSVIKTPIATRWRPRRPSGDAHRPEPPSPSSPNLSRRRRAMPCHGPARRPAGPHLPLRPERLSSDTTRTFCDGGRASLGGCDPLPMRAPPPPAPPLPIAPGA